MNWWIVALALVLLAGVSAFAVWRWSRPGVVSPVDKVVKAWRWKQIAVMGAGPVVTALLVWQLWTLDEGRWCKVANEQQFDAASALQKLSACIQVMRDILGIKDHAIIGLLFILAMIMGLFIVTEFKTKFSARGPMGTGLDIGGGTKDDDV